MRSGVYAIIHTPSGAAYIGSTTHVTGRYTWHRHALRNSYHGSKKLQELWDRDGEPAFEFRQLELVYKHQLREAEQKAQDEWPVQPLLNTRTVRGWKHTGDTKIAIHMAMSGMYK